MIVGWTTPANAQLNQNCVVAVLNRTVQANADGSWVLPNVPANFGLVRARATCVQNGITTFGQSALFSLSSNGTVNLPQIQLGSTTPIPTVVTITPQTTTLTQAGATLQLTVTATFASGSPQNITQGSTGTLYNISNPAIASVSANGLVTAISSGTVLIQAVNEGTQGVVTLQVVIGGASNGGIPNTWIISNFCPNFSQGSPCPQLTDPTFASEDPDQDGLTNLQEFQLGTDPNNPDTDRDGLTDGQEALLYHTNPLLFSTDGTGISDGIEVQTGTLGLSLSQKLAKAISTLTVSPSTFVLNVNTIQGLASQQLAVKATLIDGKTVLDLTSTSTGTNYSSSDLTICNFGAPDGNVFAGNNGTCTITITNSGFTAKATGTVITFSPTPLSFVSIPGFANGVAVNGNYAFVASGASGLQVVNVADRRHPFIAASLGLAGNANDVTLLGNYAYVAGGGAGLHVVDVTNPLVPVRLGTLSTGGTALDVVVRGTTAYVANSSNLFIADVTNPASMVKMGSLALAGTIRGVDVDPIRKVAVVTGGTGGVYVVDVSNPSAPVLRGSLSTAPEAHDVAIKGNYAFIADYFSFSESYLNSLASVDISVPSSPILRSTITNESLGGNLNDVVVSGNFALGADVVFVNGIPITDITDPTNPISRAILNFPQRDDNAMGITADGSYVYLATVHSALDKFGANEDSRLYIGQYLALTDNKGIPPTVSITSPVSGGTVIQGSKLPITVNASDDVAVAAVNFVANGQVVYTSTSSPYQFNYIVPTNITTLTLSATAIDFGNNIGMSQNVVLTVVPDPGTTVSGRVVDKNHNPVAGATVSTLGGLSATTVTDGTFSIAGVPTVQGPVSVSAKIVINGTTLAGLSAALPPVVSGTTNVGDVVIGQSQTVFLIGSDAVSFHGDSIFAHQLWALLGGNVAYINDFGLLGNTAIDGQPVTGFSSVPASLAGFSALFFASPGSCCGDPSTDPSLGIASNASAIASFVAGGGIIVIEDFQGASAWDSILGFTSAPGVITGTGITCSDPGVSTAAGVAAGFTGNSAGTNTYVDSCFIHEVYSDSFFAAQGFTSLIDGANFPSGTGVVLTRGLKQ
jgi:hypothetical protein